MTAATSITVQLIGLGIVLLVFLIGAVAGIYAGALMTKKILRANGYTLDENNRLVEIPRVETEQPVEGEA
jgi:uncharacterized membrane protein